MPEEPKTLSPRHAVGWTAMGVLIVAAVLLYFIYGRTVPLLTAEPEASAPGSVAP